MVEVDRPEIMLLQETLGACDEVKAKLESWFGGWCFENLDVRGRSSRLAIGWNTRIARVLNVWGMDSVLGMTFKALEHVDIFSVINIYGLYLNRIPFRDKIFSNTLLRGDMMIIGGDLNFSLGWAEVWGPHARTDLLSDYFTRNLVERNWLDVEPCVLKPVCKNNRCREGRVAKRLDRFLVTKKIVDNHHFIRQWVGKGGHSDHFPIFLEFKNGPVKPPSPLKFNKTWLKDDSFMALISNGWAPYDPGIGTLLLFNLQRISGI